MPHRDSPGKLAEATFQLEKTAGVCCRNEGSAGFDNVPDLAFLQLRRHFRLSDVIDASAPAAPGRLREFSQSETWNRFQDLPWLLGDLLAVTEVACFMISDRPLVKASFSGPRFSKADLTKPLMNVADFR